MGVFSPLQGTLQSRCLVYYRAEPDVVARWLPEGIAPSVYRGYSLVGLCWSRCLGIPGRFLLRRLAPVWDELAFCFPVASGDASGLRHRVWVSRRETSSRFSAHWMGRVLRGEYALADFAVAEEPGRVELRVEHEGREELFLRAESAAELVGSLFLSMREVAEYLRQSGATEPRNPLVPTSPDVSEHGRWAIDPLEVFDLRCPFFEDRERFPAGSLALDSAFRFVRVRLARDVAPAEVLVRATAPYVPI